jgi:hypothetical protein
VKIIYPPRPKGKMHPKDLDYYEKTNKWVAQRKFRGSRCLLNVSPNQIVTIANRHGTFFKNFTLDKEYLDEILGSLKFETGKEYWLDGELMNKDVNATNEIILFDVLQAGRYLFGFPDQLTRLGLLTEICGNPQILCPSGIALQISNRLRMAETFQNNFESHYKEAIDCKQLEGLVLRRKAKSLDNHGSREYETDDLIRCRKPFACETHKANRSGGYEF